MVYPRGIAMILESLDYTCGWGSGWHVILLLRQLQMVVWFWSVDLQLEMRAGGIGHYIIMPLSNEMLKHLLFFKLVMLLHF